MRSHPRSALIVMIAATLAFSGCIAPVRSARGDTQRAAEGRLALAGAVIDQWSTISKLAARLLMDEYGIPDEVRHDRLIWRGNGVWRRTVVQDESWTLAKAEAEPGIVKQTICYPLTPQQAAQIKTFDPRVTYDRKSGELSSLSEQEEGNFLRLNLAADIAKGRLDPKTARENYAKILQLEASGKTSPYLKGLFIHR